MCAIIVGGVLPLAIVLSHHSSIINIFYFFWKVIEFTNATSINIKYYTNVLTIKKSLFVRFNLEKVGIVEVFDAKSIRLAKDGHPICWIQKMMRNQCISNHMMEDVHPISWIETN